MTDAVLFDAWGTCFSLEPLRGALVMAGLAPTDLEAWIARAQRDAAALAAAGGHASFAEVLAADLAGLFAERGAPGGEAQARGIVDGMSALPPYPDLADAFAVARGRGIVVAVVTNGSEKTTRAALGSAGLSPELVISVDEVARFKPGRDVYLHACRRLSVPPGRAALLAAHAWDVHGAKAAGLRAGFVHRRRGAYPAHFTRPDAEGDSLPMVIERL